MKVSFFSLGQYESIGFSGGKGNTGEMYEI